MTPHQAAQLRILIITAAKATAEASAALASASDDECATALEAIAAEHNRVNSYIKGITQPAGQAGWKLAMRVLQSDLYGVLDDAERAECDALCRANPTFPKKAPSPDWLAYHSALSQCAELLDNMTDGDPIIDTPTFLKAKLTCLAADAALEERGERAVDVSRIASTNVTYNLDTSVVTVRFNSAPAADKFRDQLK